MQLATELSLSSYAAANLAYGKLAHDVAEALGYSPNPDMSGAMHWWRTLAYGNDDSPQTEDGSYGWIMRPQLVDALQEMKWA